MQHKKDPALSAYGKIGGQKSAKRLKRKLGAEAYRKRMREVALCRWNKLGHESKQAHRKAGPGNKKAVPNGHKKV